MKLPLGGQAGREKLLAEAEKEMQLHPDRIEIYYSTSILGEVQARGLSPLPTRLDSTSLEREWLYQLAVILAMQGRTQEAKERLVQAKQQLITIGYTDTAQQLAEAIHLLEQYPR